MDEQAFERRLQEVAKDRTHGASELARHCLEIAADSARHAPAKDAGDLMRTLQGRAAAMIAARPSMAPVDNLLARWQERLAGLPVGDLESARRKAADAALALEADSRRAAGEAAAQAAAHIGSGRAIITHSLSSTVLEVFQRLKDSGVSAIVTESRPLQEGQKLAAWLSELAIPTTFITDAQIGGFVARADLALVGADSLLADGSVVNKAGTYLLALAAKDRGIPFYVCCESFKRLSADAAQPVLEEMAPSELGAPEWPHVTVANVYFDITPARLVSAWFTEHGILRQSDALR